MLGPDPARAGVGRAAATVALALAVHSRCQLVLVVSQEANLGQHSQLPC
jgi:hypothetical protein